MRKTLCLIGKILVVAALFLPPLYLAFFVASVVSAVQAIVWFGVGFIPAYLGWAWLDDLEG